MQSTILVILPTWAVFFAISLPPSADSAKINIISTNGKQDAARRLKPTGGKHARISLLYFSAPSYYKGSVETNFLIFAIAFSH